MRRFINVLIVIILGLGLGVGLPCLTYITDQKIGALGVVALSFGALVIGAIYVYLYFFKNYGEKTWEQMRKDRASGDWVRVIPSSRGYWTADKRTAVRMHKIIIIIYLIMMLIICTLVVYYVFIKTP